VKFVYSTLIGNRRLNAILNRAGVRPRLISYYEVFENYAPHQRPKRVAELAATGIIKKRPKPKRIKVPGWSRLSKKELSSTPHLRKRER
jgi:hypothetical protein